MNNKVKTLQCEVPFRFTRLRESLLAVIQLSPAFLSEFKFLIYKLQPV